jgi:hypothetical protein
MLSSAIEPGDPRVTGLVSELGAVKVLEYLEAAREVENHWGLTTGRELAHDPGNVLGQVARRDTRFLLPAMPNDPASSRACVAPGDIKVRTKPLLDRRASLAPIPRPYV